MFIPSIPPLFPDFPVVLPFISSSPAPRHLSLGPLPNPTGKHDPTFASSCGTFPARIAVLPATYFRSPRVYLFLISCRASLSASTHTNCIPICHFHSNDTTAFSCFTSNHSEFSNRTCLFILNLPILVHRLDRHSAHAASEHDELKINAKAACKELQVSFKSHRYYLATITLPTASH